MSKVILHPSGSEGGYVITETCVQGHGIMRQDNLWRQYAGVSKLVLTRSCVGWEGQLDANLGPCNCKAGILSQKSLRTIALDSKERVVLFT